MIFYSKWLGLPLSTRVLLAEKFGIPRKGFVEVFSNTIKSDGYFIQDIEAALTVTKLQEALETNEADIAKLFDDAILLVQGNYVKTKTGDENKGGTSSGDEGKLKVPRKTKVYKRKTISSGSGS